jgi:hypothetical protein
MMQGFGNHIIAKTYGKSMFPKMVVSCLSRGEFARIRAIRVDANNRIPLVVEFLMKRFIGINKYLSIGSILMLDVLYF